MNEPLHFQYPFWLLTGLAGCGGLWWLCRHFESTKAAALRQFAATHLLGQLTATVSLVRRIAKRWLILSSAALLFITLARPQLGFRWEEAKRRGIDILFAVDVSKSMLAQDINPNRLMRAKLAVQDLLLKLEGDRVGLIAFSGNAFLQCPMTLDYDAFRQTLDALEVGIIPKGGTDVATAIEESRGVFQNAANNHKILVLITDGEDLEGRALDAAKAAAKDGLHIYTVGVGTPTGELIPVPKEGGGTDFIRDSKGQVVKSRLDENMLRKLAEETGGFYAPLGQGQGLETIYNQGLAAIPRQEISSRMRKIYTERFEWTLGLAILLLVVEMFIGDRKREFRLAIPGLRKNGGAGQTALLLLLAMGAATAQASPQSAEKAYQQGRYEEASRQYRDAAAKNPKKAELQFNSGAAAYKNNQFDDAQASFQKTLQTDQLPLQQQTFYNLGNCQYRLGQQTEKTNPQQTIQQWQQALQSYEGALKLNKDDADAKYNYELVKKKLEQLQKQQQQQQQNKQDQKDKKDQKDQNKDKQDQKNQQDQKQDKNNQKDQKDKNQQDQKDQNQSKGGGQDQKDQDQKNQPPQQNPGQPKQDQNKDGQQPKDGDKNPPKRKNPPPPGQNPEGDNKKPDSPKNEPPLLPGQMSKEDAKNLLDSLKDDEKKLPLIVPKEKGGGRLDDPTRDW
ncbi:MAG: VWA domain-containing protein [Verrucomicrobiae bacterium]|nr:VWA domain-containing protein [Verrucomicrobiae bacterium]